MSTRNRRLNKYGGGGAPIPIGSTQVELQVRAPLSSSGSRREPSPLPVSNSTPSIPEGVGYAMFASKTELRRRGMPTAETAPAILNGSESEETYRRKAHPPTNREVIGYGAPSARFVMQQQSTAGRLDRVRDAEQIESSLSKVIRCLMSCPQ